MPKKLNHSIPTDYFILNKCPSERPCTRLDCRHHLAVIWDRRGQASFIFPEASLQDLPETCVLDVATKYEGLHEADIGVLLNMSTERVKQIEFRALRKIRKDLAAVVKQVV